MSDIDTVSKGEFVVVVESGVIVVEGEVVGIERGGDGVAVELEEMDGRYVTYWESADGDEVTLHRQRMETLDDYSSPFNSIRVSDEAWLELD